MSYEVKIGCEPDSGGEASISMEVLNRYIDMWKRLWRTEVRDGEVRKRCDRKGRELGYRKSLYGKASTGGRETLYLLGGASIWASKI